MLKKLLTSTAIVLTTLSFAHADDHVDWEGYYAGIGLGHGSFGVDDVFPPVPIVQNDYDADGLIVTGFLGRNFVRDNLVFGLEADLTFGDVDGSEAPLIGPTIITDFAELNYMATFRGRVGVAKDDYLIFATAGYAIAEFEFDRTANNPFAPPNFSRSDQSFSGFTVGGGIDWMFTESTFARLDYAYADLGDETVANSLRSIPHPPRLRLTMCILYGCPLPASSNTDKPLSEYKRLHMGAVIGQIAQCRSLSATLPPGLEKGSNFVRPYLYAQSYTGRG